jgi:Mrp family chromosome partitioning ATPase
MIRLSNNQLPSPNDMGGGDDFDSALDDALSSRGGPPRQNALKLVHGLLRGRYLWVAGLSVLFGTIGAFLGYHHGGKMYTSTGSIRVNYVLPKVLYNDEEAGVLPGFDAYVDSQASAMTSRKVIELAVRQPKWIALFPEPSDASIINLTNRLTITTKTDVVQVESSDRDPNMAVAAVNSDIQAYRQTYIDQEEGSDEARLQQLQLIEDSLNSELAGLRRQISDITKPYGSENIEPIYANTVEQSNRIEQGIQDLNTKIVVGVGDPARPPLNGVSDQALGFLDPRLGQLDDALADAKLKLSILLNNFGDNAPTVIDARGAIRALQQQIASRVIDLRQAAAIGVNLPGMPETPTKMEVDSLRTQLAALMPRAEALEKQRIEIGNANLRVSDLRVEADDIKRRLDDVRSRKEELQVEKPSVRRVEVVSEGDLPIAPDKDTRPRLAAMGGVGGIFFAFAAVLAVGLLNARLSGPQDLQLRLGSRPFLGVVPMLADGPDFAKRAAIAAECVHGARNMLEIWGRGSKQLVIGVTSPSFGSGNTSLAMSLGVSFAAAGLRTLLVDCDFVSGGLTNRLQSIVRRDLAAVLLRTGLVTDSQLHHAMRVAAGEQPAGSPRRSLGETCVDLGYLTPAELEAALSRQSGDYVGLLDALAGEPLQSCVGTTGIRNLSILPLGSATSSHAAKVCSQALRQVLEAARQQYDTIILDTRSILGSLEASIVASAVDGMVITVARGEQSSHFRQTLNRLKALCCPLAGVIFNQAQPSDIPTIARINRSGSDGTSGNGEGGAMVEPAGRLATLGPLPRATISCVPTAKEGTELC